MSQRQKREVRRKSNMANIAITTAGGPYATSKWIRTFRSILFNLVVSLWYLTSHLCLIHHHSYWICTLIIRFITSVYVSIRTFAHPVIKPCSGCCLISLLPQVTFSPYITINCKTNCGPLLSPSIEYNLLSVRDQNECKKLSRFIISSEYLYDAEASLSSRRVH